MTWNRGLMIYCFILIGSALLVACSKEDTSGGMKDGKATISLMTILHTAEIPDDKILHELEKKTNVNLEIEWVPNNNYNEKLYTAFATGTFPDVVTVGFQQLDQFKDAIRDDQFWEIGPHLGDYENLGKLKEPIIKNTMVDGKVFGIYQGRPLSRQGMIYRKDWADNLGLSAPKTTKEVYEMARAFTEDDPDGNGKDDTIGVAERSELIYGAFKTVSSWFGTPNNWGEQHGKLLPEFMFPEYMETMNFMKNLRDNGYMNQDFPVASKEAQADMIKNGTAGMRIGGMSDVISLYNDAKALNPDIEYAVHNYVEGPDEEYGIWAIPGFGSMILFPKSAVETEEKLKEILAFYDQLMTPEIANILHWGIEGEHYRVKDGKAEITENQEKNDREVKPYMSLEVGEPETNGRYEGLHTYEPKARAEELIKENENYLIHDPTITLESETYIEDGERLREIINDVTYNYMLGVIDEDGFTKEIEKWKEQGGSKIIEEYNASWK